MWALELLLLLKRERQSRTREELIASMRASDLVVSQAVETLVAAGLAVCDEEGRVMYLPSSDAVRRLVGEAEKLYLTQPDAVRRLIVGSSRGLAAFADAFKLKD